MATAKLKRPKPVYPDVILTLSVQEAGALLALLTTCESELSDPIFNALMDLEGALDKHCGEWMHEGGKPLYINQLHYQPPA